MNIPGVILSQLEIHTMASAMGVYHVLNGVGNDVPLW